MTTVTPFTERLLRPITSLEPCQQQKAEVLGWGLSKVKQYMGLQGIVTRPWKIVTTIMQACVTEKVTNVTFSEGILRPITSLEPCQQQKADVLGWSRDKVAYYMGLEKIVTDAWIMVTQVVNRSVTEIVTVVTPFTERLLRPITSLEPCQQLKLVTDLAEEKITKEKR